MVKKNMLFPSEFLRYFPLPREIGLPYRVFVRNYEDLKNFYIKYNGRRDLFVSLYHLTLDKILFDLDILDIDLISKLYNTLRRFGPVIPVFSGQKGFHLILLLKPEPLHYSKNMLRSVQYALNDLSGLYREQDGYKVSYLDTQIFGDIKRMTRIPNSLRKYFYSVWLPKDFTKMKLEEIFEYAKSPQFPRYDFNEPEVSISYLYEELNTDVITDYLLVNQRKYSETRLIEEIEIKDEFIKYILPKVLRPCLYLQIIQPNPSHFVRTAATIDLLQCFSPDEIVEIYKKLKWENFNEKITRYQVEYLMKKGLKPYSCRKLDSICLKSCGGECKWWN